MVVRSNAIGFSLLDKMLAFLKRKIVHLGYVCACVIFEKEPSSYAVKLYLDRLLR